MRGECVHTRENLKIVCVCARVCEGERIGRKKPSDVSFPTPHVNAMQHGPFYSPAPWCSRLAGLMETLEGHTGMTFWSKAEGSKHIFLQDKHNLQ